MPEKLSTEQVDLIRRTWRVVASSPEAPAALARHLTSLAPTTAKLLDVQRADRLIAVASEIIAELDANDIDTFISRLQNLRNSQVLRALDPENVPSIHRACLFSIWEVMEQTSAEVERKEAAAKQAEAVAAEMAAKAQEAARRAAEAKPEAARPRRRRRRRRRRAAATRTRSPRRTATCSSSSTPLCAPR